MARVPLQGIPGVRDYNNPTLVPNLNQGVIVNGVLGAQSPAEILQNNTRVAAVANGLVGGSITNGDTVTLKVTNGTLPDGSLSFAYPVVTADTATTIAEGIANLINSSTAAAAAGMIAELGGTSEAPDLQVMWGGPIGNFTSLSATVSGSATETITFGQGTTVVANASANAIVAGTTITAADTLALTITNAGVAGSPITNTYTVSGGDTPTTIATGLKNLVNGNTLCTAANIAAISSAGTVTISQPGAVGNASVLSRAIAGTGNEAITFTTGGTLTGGAGVPGGNLIGGSGPVICSSNSRWQYNGSTVSLWYGQPYSFDSAMIGSIVAQTPNLPGGKPIIV